MPADSLPVYASRQGDAILLRVKVVPGASRDRIVGPLGDRLKITVSTAPTDGKANTAVLALLQKWLPKASIMLHSGHHQPTKTVLVSGISELPPLTNR